MDNVRVVQLAPVQPALHVAHVAPLLVLEHVHTLGALQAPLFRHGGLHSAANQISLSVKRINQYKRVRQLVPLQPSQQTREHVAYE